VSFIGLASLEEIISRGKVGTLDMLKVCTWILGSHFSVAVYCRHYWLASGLVMRSLFCLSTCLCLSYCWDRVLLGYVLISVFCIL